MKSQTLAACAAALLLLPAAPAFAGAASAFVPGMANLNLAGQADGVGCCSGDVAPAQSPVLAVSGFGGGTVFTFSAAGVTDGAGTGSTGPDGAYAFDMADYGLGVAPANGVGVLGLVGVFLDDSTPTGGTEPGSLSFPNLTFASLAPGLAQMFWIGDGLTGTGSGVSQLFTAPTGATRLFLGTVDGFQWANNSGGYEVEISYGGGAVPEPATWGLMVLGFAGLGAGLRTARRRTAAC